jgi:hypothetical protein
VCSGVGRAKLDSLVKEYRSYEVMGHKALMEAKSLNKL